MVECMGLRAEEIIDGFFAKKRQAISSLQLRPSTLAEIAVRADSLARFGRELADWLHTLRARGSRPALRRGFGRTGGDGR